MTRSLAVAVDRFPLARAFSISRGSKTEAVVVAVRIADGAAAGRGERNVYCSHDTSNTTERPNAQK